MADIRAVIAEDDQYSCDLMSFLLTRDRRIQVVAEGLDAMQKIELDDPTLVDVDVILLDTELTWDKDWPIVQMRRLARRRAKAKVICLATAPDRDRLQALLDAGCHGYVLKDEVHYALGDVVVHAAAGSWVTTPSIIQFARLKAVQLPESTLVVNGTSRLEQLDARYSTIARLCLLFNQPYKEVADELDIGAGHVGDLVTELYEALGLNAILSGAESPEELFDDEEIIELFHDAINQRRENPRARPDMKTLAFHLLTLPEIEKRPNSPSNKEG